MKCRHCGTTLDDKVLDLGNQPYSNAFLTDPKYFATEQIHPLAVYVCTMCWLMQLPQDTDSRDLFTNDYVYFSSTTQSWCDHARTFVSAAVDLLSLGSKSWVVEIASNDGYLLRHLVDRGIPCLGIEPTENTAKYAQNLGVDTLNAFFNATLAEELVRTTGKADLIIGNNVLAHVPDINDFLLGVKILLGSNGTASFEFPHLLRLLKGGQFDTIYHEHYSYLSLSTLALITNKVGLQITNVEVLDTHGGSLRMWLTHKQANVPPTHNVKTVMRQEKHSSLNTLRPYKILGKTAERTKQQLVQFLDNIRKTNRKLLAYGAAAKGNTLLNYANITTNDLSAVADKAENKQGKYLPGSHLPVISPERLVDSKPSDILILPWNIAHEIKAELEARLPQSRFWIAVPTVLQL